MRSQEDHGTEQSLPKRCERCGARRKLYEVGIFDPQWVCWACANHRPTARFAGSQLGAAE